MTSFEEEIRSLNSMIGDSSVLHFKPDEDMEEGDRLGLVVEFPNQDGFVIRISQSGQGVAAVIEAFVQGESAGSGVCVGDR